jgi:hypothetical protein
MSQPSYITRELNLSGPLSNGSRGADVRRAQEWLNLHRRGTAIDGDFGDATERSVRDFQKAKGLAVTGKITTPTWDALVSPLQTALQMVGAVNGARNMPSVLLKVARQHVAQHPMEVGGDNCGPWVRLYMRGNEGRNWFWCAGFVTFLLRQASQSLGQAMPVPGSESCDSLAYQAQERGLFVSGKDLAAGRARWSDLGSVSVFLVRKSATDWVHCGLAFNGSGEVFSTVEGNTNDDGSRNGYEACMRTRSIQGKDFIRLQ